MPDRIDVVSAGILVADFFPNVLDRLPTPGELSLLDSLEIRPGGCAANTAIALSRLGVATAVCGKVGADAFGDYVVGELAAEGLDVSGVARSKKSETSKTIILTVSGEDRRYLHLTGANADFAVDDVGDTLLERTKLIYVGGFLGMASLDPTDLARLFEDARRRGVTTVLDVIAPGGTDGDLRSVFDRVLPAVDFFMPNADEATTILGEGDPVRHAREFVRMGAGTAIITLGADGVVACDGVDSVRAGVYPVRFVDGSGAGDAFAAGFISGLLDGAPLRRCIESGSAMGGSCVREVGCSAGLFDRGELDGFVAKNRLETEAIEEMDVG